MKFKNTPSFNLGVIEPSLRYETHYNANKYFVRYLEHKAPVPTCNSSNTKSSSNDT